jgi:hypothetical protein
MTERCELADDCRVRQRRAEARRLAADPKRKGELAELVFALTAASYGLTVSKPYGESAAYDFLVQSGKRVLRVQVKACFTRYRAGHFFNIGHHGRHYTKEEVDFLAAYVALADIWYIIPIEIVQAVSVIAVKPGAKGKQAGARFEPYREAWDLLRRKSRGKKPTTEANDLKVCAQ